MAADDLLLRQAPHSPQAEQAVLGSMLIDPDCIKDVMDKLQPEDFYLRANRDIFETIYTYVHLFPAHRRRHCGGGDGAKRRLSTTTPGTIWCS